MTRCESAIFNCLLIITHYLSASVWSFVIGYFLFILCAVCYDGEILCFSELKYVHVESCLKIGGGYRKLRSRVPIFC